MKIFLTEIEIIITEYMNDGDKREKEMFLVEAENVEQVKEKVLAKYVSDPYGTYYIVNFNYINEMIK